MIGSPRWLSPQILKGTRGHGGFLMQSAEAKSRIKHSPLVGAILEPVMAPQANRAIRAGEPNEAFDTLERKIRNAWWSVERIE